MYQFLLNTLDTIISVSELKYTRYISQYKMHTHDRATHQVVATGIYIMHDTVTSI
jgi:hypothetical protein